MSHPTFQVIDPTQIDDAPTNATSLITVVKDLCNAIIAINENTRLLYDQLGLNTADISTIGRNHSALETLVQNLETMLICAQTNIT